jgi:hypothetical protein
MPKAIIDHWDEDEPAASAQPRRVRRARRRPLPWLRMALLSPLSIAVLVSLARQHDRPAPPHAPQAVPAAVLVAPAPLWRPLPSAPAPYGLEGRAEPIAIEAREHMSGGREDTLSFGAFGDAGYGRISLVQGFTEPARSFFVDIVRRAAEAGLSVTRNAQSRPVPTKFGPMEVAAVTLAGPAEQACQAFRFADAQASFAFQGWVCGSEAQPVNEGHLACLVDRIALAATDNPAVKAIFAEAERQRLEGCGPAGRTASVEIRSPGRP